MNDVLNITTIDINHIPTFVYALKLAGFKSLNMSEY